MVFADPEAQFTAMTVEDELVFGMENLGMTIPEIRERLEWVTELTDLKRAAGKTALRNFGRAKTARCPGRRAGHDPADHDPRRAHLHAGPDQPQTGVRCAAPA